MKREQHLTRSSQFAAVYGRGRSWASAALVMKALPNGLELTRFGFSISKRVGKAVVRNRIRRRLRECVQAAPWKPGWDVVFIARSTASSADYPHLMKTVQTLGQQARLNGQQ